MAPPRRNAKADRRFAAENRRAITRAVHMGSDDQPLSP